MVLMPQQVIDMINRPNTNKVMATVSPDGLPHTIVCGSLMSTAPDTIIVGEAFMYRTVENLEKNRNAEFIVWSGRDAYSIKAVAQERKSEGPEYQRMTELLSKMNMSVTAIWIFKATEVWDESASKNAGDRVV